MADFTQECLQEQYANPGYDFDRLSVGGGDEGPPTLSIPSLSATPVIELKELDIQRDILPNEGSLNERTGGGRYLIIGRPGSGKSVLMKDILYYKRDFLPVISVVSQTEAFNQFYQGFIPPIFIHDTFRPDIISDFIARQEKVMKRLDYPSAFGGLILDDCAADCKIMNSKEVENLLKNGRHMNMLVIIANQYVLDMKPPVRACFDGVFILRNSITTDRKKIHDNFASIIPWEDFNRLMNEMTENYGCIFINNRSGSNNWQECVYVYTAVRRENFDTCCPAARRFSSDRINVS